MCYFSHALRYPVETVNCIAHALLDPKFDRINFVVGTGMSGTLVLVPVMMKSGIPCGAVRKVVDAEKSSLEGGSHSYSMVETFLPEGHRVYRYVIVDDLIESGRTIHSIIRAMKTQLYDHTQCVGIILYQNYELDQGRTYLGIPITRLNKDIVELDTLNHRKMVNA